MIGLTVKELKNILKEYPDNTEILIGIDEISTEYETIKINYDTEYNELEIASVNKEIVKEIDQARNDRYILEQIKNIIEREVKK